ncbi:hypothetical protein [Streptomyces sp. NBC_01750]|nr:hypothetical protein [Streptomyces sp. NBC_01750]WSD30556.1 hypothetical protein OG966_00300 [Streptomyces sp. NBC_01750]
MHQPPDRPQRPRVWHPGAKTITAELADNQLVVRFDDALLNL